VSEDVDIDPFEGTVHDPHAGTLEASAKMQEYLRIIREAPPLLGSTIGELGLQAFTFTPSTSTPGATTPGLDGDMRDAGIFSHGVCTIITEIIS
jgi:hypothetical protein